MTRQLLTRNRRHHQPLIFNGSLGGMPSPQAQIHSNDHAANWQRIIRKGERRWSTLSVETAEAGKNGGTVG